MRIYKISQSSNLVLPKGTILFHGTLETYDYQKIKPGIDRLFWTTEHKNIALSYIPSSGGEVLATAGSIATPTTQSSILAIQKAIGIHYDTSSFEMQGSQVVSYQLAPVFQEERFWNNAQLKCDYVIEKMRSVLGYEPEGDSGCYSQYRVKLNMDKVLKRDEQQKGTLLTLELKRDMEIYDLTRGGKVEGDYLDPDYRKMDLFDKIQKQNFDGIKINDFHNTRDLGLFGHESIGFFSKALKDIKIIQDEGEHPKGSLW